jgi:hypothetical protein
MEPDHRVFRRDQAGLQRGVDGFDLVRVQLGAKGGRPERGSEIACNSIFELLFPTALYSF